MFIEAAFESLPQLITQFYGFTRVTEEGGNGIVGLAVIFAFSAAMSLTCIIKAIVVFKYNYGSIKRELGSGFDQRMAFFARLGMTEHHLQSFDEAHLRLARRGLTHVDFKLLAEHIENGAAHPSQSARRLLPPAPPAATQARSRRSRRSTLKGTRWRTRGRLPSARCSRRAACRSCRSCGSPSAASARPACSSSPSRRSCAAPARW